MTFEELLASAGPDAIIVAQEKTVAFANAAAHELLAEPSGALVGRPLAALLADGEPARIEAVLAQRQQEGFADLPQVFRLRLRRARAEVVVDARFARAGDQLVLSARDATEQVRAERLTGRLAELARGGHNLVSADALLDAAEPVFLELGWRGALVRLVPGGSVTLRAVACAPGDPLGEYVKSLLGQVVPMDRTVVIKEVLAGRRPLYLDNIPTFLSGPMSSAVPLSESMARAHVYRSAWCPIFTGADELTHVLALGGRGMSEHDFVAVQLFAAQLGAAIDLARLRTELVRRERLAAIGELAAALAHEVRNPLGVVFNAAAGLRREVQSASGHLLVASLAEEAERLQRLMVDLLEFSRPVTPALATLTLGPLLTEVTHAVARPYPPSARPTVRVEPGTPDVSADARMLRRAVEGLVANALDHVSPGGRVEVTARSEGGRVRVRVYNDGPPLTPGMREKVFEPFFTTEAAGAGLGLAVVRRMTEDLGGTVEVEDVAGGVAFSLLLAAAPTEAPAPPAPGPRGAD